MAAATKTGNYEENNALRAEVEKIAAEGTWQEGADHLRRMVKSRALNYTDMTNHPERFFAAHRCFPVSQAGIDRVLHRIIGEHFLGGFGTRFTVQFNLFAGSIIGMGGASHLQQVHQEQRLTCY